MALLVDVHSHLDHPSLYKKLDEVITNAKNHEINAIITSGIDFESNRKALEISKRFDIVKCSLGIYPVDALKKETTDVYKYKPFNIDEEIEFIKQNKDNIIAIGEIGLDYVASNDKEKSEQKQLFQRMLTLAETIKKPVIIHSRKAEAEVVDIIETSKLKKIVMHCFSGKFKLVKRIADKGWFFSIPTNIVRAQNFQKMAMEVPLSQILTETDAPYLSPFRHKINEPAHIIETIKTIAEIKKMDVVEVKNNIYFNYQKVFL